MQEKQRKVKKIHRKTSTFNLGLLFGSKTSPTYRTSSQAQFRGFSKATLGNNNDLCDLKTFLFYKILVELFASQETSPKETLFISDSEDDTLSAASFKSESPSSEILNDGAAAIKRAMDIRREQAKKRFSKVHQKIWTKTYQKTRKRSKQRKNRSKRLWKFWTTGISRREWSPLSAMHLFQCHLNALICPCEATTVYSQRPVIANWPPQTFHSLKIPNCTFDNFLRRHLLAVLSITLQSIILTHRRKSSKIRKFFINSFRKKLGLKFSKHNFSIIFLIFHLFYGFFKVFIEFVDFSKIFNPVLDRPGDLESPEALPVNLKDAKFASEDQKRALSTRPDLAFEDESYQLISGQGHVRIQSHAYLHGFFQFSRFHVSVRAKKRPLKRTRLVAIKLICAFLNFLEAF